MTNRKWFRWGMLLNIAVIISIWGSGCCPAIAVGPGPASGGPGQPAQTAAVATFLAATATPGTKGAPAGTGAPGVTTGGLPASGAPAPTPAPAAPISANDFSAAVRAVAQKVKPAVVQITNEQIQVDQFNQPFAVPAGVGSGVIYDDQGHILTNNHVIEGAQQLLVSLPDGRSFQGKVIGADPQTDLAVIQIQGNNLPVAQLGDSRALQVGDWVVAIGNALALPGGPTVTAGVVSAMNRTVQEPGSNPNNPNSQGPFLFDVIQTSAPINPGNSGGALVNLAGQVIGINTLVAGEAEPGVQAQGIGFAISINTAKPIADQIVSTGRAVHPYIGVGTIPLSPAIATQLGVQATDGAVIMRVVQGSPAAQAGLRARDVIVEADGKALQGDSALQEAINAHKPGDRMTLTVLRGGQRQQVTVTLGERPTP